MNNETNTWRKVKRLFPNLDSLTQKQIDYELDNAKQEVIEELLGLECLKEERITRECMENIGRTIRNQLRNQIKEEIKKL